MRSYIVKIDSIVIVLLSIFIFFTSVLSPIITYSILLSALFILPHKASITFKVDHHNSYVLRYLLFIVMLTLNFVIAPFKDLNFFIGTIVSLIIGLTLCFKIRYLTFRNSILIFSVIHLLFFLWNFFSKKTFLFFIQYILPPEKYSEIVAFSEQGLITGLNTQTSPIAIYIVLLIGLLFYELTINRKKYNLLIIVLLFFILILTGRRSAILIILVGFILSYYYTKMKRISLKTLMKSTFISLITLVFIFVIYKIGILNELYLRTFPNGEFNLTYTSLNNILSGRLSLIVHAYNYFLDQPIFGNGFKFFFYTVGQDVHNLYLQMLCEGGIVGLIIMVYFIFSNYRATKKEIRNISIHATPSMDLMLSFFIQVLFIVYSFFENPFSDRYIFLLYMFGLALFNNYKKNISEISSI